MKSLLLVVCGLLISSSSVVNAKDKNLGDDYTNIVAGLLGADPAQQPRQVAIADKEVIRLMTDLGLNLDSNNSSITFVPFTGEYTNSPTSKKKKEQYQERLLAKRTQTNSQLQFANASYRLNRRALNKIDALAQTYQLAKDQIKQITIKGHTNSIGSDQDNLVLSRNRAASVKAALLRLGIPSNIIRIHGYGETQPLKNTNAAAPINRRVEYEVLKK